MKRKLIISLLDIAAGSLIIEVSKSGDRNHTVLREIYIDNPLESKKEFDKEISFWFMENGSSL